MCFDLRQKFPVLNDGSVKLVSYLGDDDLIAEAARQGRESSNPTHRLIRYMMRHGHTTPFEFPVLIFHVRLPIFVARQWMRHRTGAFNEMSGRYMELPTDTFWFPEGSDPEDDGPLLFRGQSKKNHQGSSKQIVRHEPLAWDECPKPGEDASRFGAMAEEVAAHEYAHRLDFGVSREQARSCLPVSTYTEFYWKVDLHNLLNFLRLRLDEHAQEEIRVYARTIEKIVEAAFPITYAAWVEFVRDAVTLSKTEADLILRGLNVEWEDVKEMEETKAKMKKIGYMMVSSKPHDGATQ